MSSRAADGIRTRPGADEDVPAVIQLMKQSLGEGNVPRTPEFWHWKHRANPFGASPMWLAYAGDALVGVRLFLRWRLRSADREYRAVRAVDTATHPDFQGRGIFTRLTTQLVEAELSAGTDLIFNTPNDKSRPGYLKMGWSEAGRLPLWIKPLRPLRMLSAWLSRAATASDSAGDWAEPRPVTPDAFSRAACSRLVRERGRAGYHTQLSPEYFAWRYSPPGLSYQLESAGDDAMLVFRIRRRGPLRELRVCDALLGDEPRGLRALRSCLSRAIEHHRPDYVVAALRTERLHIGAAAALGFVPAPRIGPVLTVRPLCLSSLAPNPRLMRRWSASIGDLELF